MKSFKDFALPGVLTHALEVMGFQAPTPIQAKAIPVALSHRDLIACAQTGTGKTAAFLLPVLTRLLKTPDKTALVLVPTRELGQQVQDVLGLLVRFAPEIRSVLLIGGVPLPPQVRAIRKNPRIIVATPGRLMDHLRQGNVSLSSTSMVVLDEADRMLDMGFAPQINQILKFLPVSRQTLLFSATIPPDIEHLARRLLKDPVHVAVEKTALTTPKISQSIIEVTQHQKFGALAAELGRREGSVIVFVRTKSRTDRLARQLSEEGFNVNRIHGGRTQGQRKQAIAGFRAGKCQILVATDIAARGLDINDVGHVINYDLPMVPEDYVHRIGRTARAGATGEAMSFVTREDSAQWRAIQKFLGKSGHAVTTRA